MAFLLARPPKVKQCRTLLDRGIILQFLVEPPFKRALLDY
jgi:hypothetical protein